MIRILAYSDIHHHEYTNGLTETDVYNLEHRIADMVRQHRPDFMVFGGDRFQSRNPTDYVKYMADRSFLEVLVACSEVDAKPIALVGNHDRSTKSETSHHSMMSTTLLRAPCTLLIADEPRRLDFNMRDGQLVSFHCIPAGFKNGFHVGQVLPDAKNILLFHDMIDGCLTTAGTTFMGDNYLVEILKSFKFDAVIAGDNHRAQAMSNPQLTGDNTVIYCGSPMQHNINDNPRRVAGAPGSDDSGTVLLLDVHDDKIDIRRLKTNSPSFLEMNISAGSIVELLDAVSGVKDSRLSDSILSVSVLAQAPLDVPSSRLESKIKEITKARRVSVSISDAAVPAPEIVPEVVDSDLWRSFVTSRGYDNADEIISTGLDFINDKYN